MKYVLLLLMLSLLILGACTSPQGTPAIIEDTTAQNTDKEDVASTEIIMTKQVDVSGSTFTFEGYGPGKTHLGTFNVWSGKLSYDANGMVVAASGVIDAKSVDTGIDGLNTHLKSDDFFVTDTYPTIEIESTRITEDMMTADLTFIGTTKSITFPINQTINGISANFLLDIRPFGIKYIGIDKEVKIMFDLMAE